MAMTVRLSPELDAQLQKIADARHTSKHALVLQAVEEYMTRDIKTRRVLESIDETSRDYAETIKRLEDA
ncbi:MAG TPA: ribbon-helix-helix protein, CopG family [Homoserinimonas sp.]|nr:ribbon-helix-helix protein, CopG family [Homoserinimonas sp.]